MAAKWVEVRKSILQMHDSVLPTEETLIEEAREIKRLLTVYSRLTPKQFSEAIRKAAREKARFLSEHPNAFPKLYCYDIEEELQAAGRELLKAKPETLQLAQNTGGNVFWGEPSEALAREWPRIVEQTMNMRRMLCVPDWRYRFWHCSNKEEKASAQQILLEMVSRLKAKWPEWSQQKALDLEKAIFKQEYWMAYPDWKGVVDGMGSTRDSAELDRLWDETSKRITQAYKANQSQIPSIDLFPKPDECSKCAIFDMYLSFWQDLQGTVTAEVIE